MTEERRAELYDRGHLKRDWVIGERVWRHPTMRQAPDPPSAGSHPPATKAPPPHLRACTEGEEAQQGRGTKRAMGGPPPPMLAGGATLAALAALAAMWDGYRVIRPHAEEVVAVVAEEVAYATSSAIRLGTVAFATLVCAATVTALRGMRLSYSRVEVQLVNDASCVELLLTAFTYDDPELTAAATAARLQGAEVRLLIDLQKAQACKESGRILQQLLDAQIEVRTTCGCAEDGVALFVGSHNLTTASPANREFVTELRMPAADTRVATYRSWYEGMWSSFEGIQVETGAAPSRRVRGKKAPQSDAAKFAVAVQVTRLAVALIFSSGTAAFYALLYRRGKQPEGLPRDFFIGKDVAHASDELDFYARLREAVKEGGSWAAFGRMAMACPGIVRLECLGAKSHLRTKRLLLLLENLRHGFERMRLLDVKLGAETSVAGWKGKSRLNAWKNACVDQRTNSAVEGFRLEGMELPPQSLEKRILEVLQAKSTATAKYISPKVIRRFTLQRLRAADFLESWLDVSDLGAGAELHAQKAALATFKQTQLLLTAVLGLEVPQQWIGSSVALAMEVGSSRCLGPPPRVAVKVFDWGRAELNTLEDFNSLASEEKESRRRYWKQYLQALARMHWELGRLVAHRFCCPAWSVFVMELRAVTPVVLRAALLGETLSASQEVLGMGLFQMSPEGGHGEISLPLLGAVRQETLLGSLRLRIGIPVHGIGACSVEVCETFDVEVGELFGCIVTVKVIAFERPGDARMHLEAFQSGCPAPLPRGHVCSRSTSPATATQGKLVWQDHLEFYGLGEAAQAAEAEVRDCLESLGVDCTGDWLASMPPSISEPADVDEKAAAFLTCVLPSLDTAKSISQ
ncbi:hypothetical protein AK812_SmicGene12294 [Symbiodinium microadriaticum]|uniref:Phospholipase D-like domain-containing protein n=1 Tax=Symbiodinium microadriaticum TaxID=2951 RepID=A0A1Q9EB48_SYMMI|nr:hypothetical protein AK812_SmicGene12294 [Symbiodinium microadriaticum]